MGNSLDESFFDDTGIFSNELKTFDNLLELLNTSVGYNTHENPLDNDNLEIDS